MLWDLNILSSWFSKFWIFTHVIMSKVYKKVKGTFVIDTFQINSFMSSEFSIMLDYSRQGWGFSMPDLYDLCVFSCAGLLVNVFRKCLPSSYSKQIHSDSKQILCVCQIRRLCMHDASDPSLLASGISLVYWPISSLGLLCLMCWAK